MENEMEWHVWADAERRREREYSAKQAEKDRREPPVWLRNCAWIIGFVTGGILRFIYEAVFFAALYWFLGLKFAVIAYLLIWIIGLLMGLQQNGKHN